MTDGASRFSVIDFFTAHGRSYIVVSDNGDVLVIRVSGKTFLESAKLHDKTRPSELVVKFFWDNVEHFDNIKDVEKFKQAYYDAESL